MVPSEKQHDQARQQQEKRESRQEQFGACLPSDEHGQSYYQNSGASPRRPQRNLREPRASLPNHECREGWHEEAMREVRVVPPLSDEMNQRRSIEPEREGRQDDHLPKGKSVKTRSRSRA